MKKTLILVLTLSAFLFSPLLVPVQANNVVQVQGDAGNDQLVNDEFQVTNETFDSINPLKTLQDQQVEEDLTTPRGIISRMLRFAFPLAGLILFVMIIWGGFQTVMNAGSKKNVEAGKERITAAIAGFIMLFASYWVVQIIEFMFDVTIL